jgi:GAF domain-containing protein
MAVPIILDGKAVGVLDVQQDKIAGLDEGDANLLRTLANQAAVSIRNARLFNQVETALAEARIAQERYLSQAWEKGKLKAQNNQYHYTRPDAPALDEITLNKAKQAALAQDRPALITAINGQESSSVIGNLLDHPEEISSLVAPINLQNKTIGVLQLHAADDGRPWTEEDLELVAAVVDQLAQTAENLRLFEETRQRADFERLAGEITQKIRQSPNLEALTKTAAEVLGQALGASEGVIRLSVSASKKPDNKGGNGHVH